VSCLTKSNLGFFQKRHFDPILDGLSYKITSTGGCQYELPIQMDFYMRWSIPTACINHFYRRFVLRTASRHMLRIYLSLDSDKIFYVLKAPFFSRALPKFETRVAIIVAEHCCLVPTRPPPQAPPLRASCVPRRVPRQPRLLSPPTRLLLASPPRRPHACLLRGAGKEREEISCMICIILIYIFPKLI
jgi:hypothetical protein